ncbi:MAG: ferredoxin [bacterium]
MKATVDEDVCVGTSDCEAICPQVFKVVDGVSKVQVDTVPPDAEDTCRQAAENCPVDAITVEE